MKGKYEKKKSRKKSPLIWIAAAMLVITVGLWLASKISGEPQNPPAETSAAQPEIKVTEATQAPQTTEVLIEPQPPETITPTETTDAPTSFDLGNGLVVSGFGDYTGLYMEDGSNEIVSGVMMIMVTNNSEYPLQYAEITLDGEAGDAQFSLSTLNPGQTAVVLEVDRKPFSSGDSYTEATSDKVVYFDESLNTHGDILKIQPLNGGFNISNISDKDITGDITVYYKNYAGDMLYGGITYRGTVSGGLGAGQIKQIMASTFTESGTAVMFVSISES